MQIKKRGIVTILTITLAAAFLAACGNTPTTSNSGSTNVDPNETAAKVNGKVIKMEEVDRAVKAQAQGQDNKLSPLELAGARLQVLQSLVEQEVMFQKAEKEGTIPTEDEITAEINKQKTQSGKSADQIEKELKDSGMTEASFRETAKKSMAITKLVEKITGKIEPPKDSEIEAFYNGNKEAFVKKKGVKLGAIVIDPANNGEGDTTTDEQSAVLKGNEIIKKLQAGVDFASVARESSEDQSKFQGGDLGYVSEEEMKQTFPAQVVASLMNPQFEVGKIITAPMMGKFYILKLQERSDKDEAVTLESPGIRQQVTESLISSRKQLLAASYQAIAMAEAKIENFLAKKVVDNPNELSGARPAGASSSNTNTAASNTNTAANTVAPANAANKPAANEPAKPAANASANKPAANAPANK
ncbi:MAG: SurA N-terminal domain-containing protein [Pyrinomonadaceae bacterium]|nr:SurA N-terminal domain-containing protein [Acidobacteriota bacterium]MBP7476626.1 SurA N-terminal domain-containing protein [Pyrinomonadaceae bacterium]MBP9110386.1 SurA N-terminal domain-containing protein [Pyrinomonadaceae bacterium]